MCVHAAPYPRPLMSNLSLCSAEQWAAERRWFGPHPDRRWPDAVLRWHGHHSQWSIIQYGSQGPQRQAQRQHVRGGTGARAGHAGTRVAEPGNQAGFPHWGPRLTTIDHYCWPCPPSLHPGCSLPTPSTPLTFLSIWPDPLPKTLTQRGLLNLTEENWWMKRKMEGSRGWCRKLDGFHPCFVYWMFTWIGVEVWIVYRETQAKKDWL